MALPRTQQLGVPALSRHAEYPKGTMCRMKRIQEMTVRERSRMVCCLGAALVLAMFIFALAVQD